MKTFFMFMGIPLTSNTSTEEVFQILNSGRSICTFVNPQSYYLANQNQDYLESLNRFDYVFCDGIGLVAALKLLGRKEMARRSFDTTSIAPIVFGFAQKNQKSLVLIGGRTSVSKNARTTILTHYPNLDIRQVYSGYNQDIDNAKKFIHSNSIDIVICGMGVPYQEEFILSLRECGWDGIGFTCGGYFDQLQANINYYPILINQLNIRFLYRLYKEPARLAKRYFVYYSYFIYKVLNTFLRELFRR